MDTHAHVSTHKHVHTNTYTQTHKGRKSQLWWCQTSYGNYHDDSTHATEMGGPLSHCHWWRGPQALWAQRGHIWPLTLLPRGKKQQISLPPLLSHRALFSMRQETNCMATALWWAALPLFFAETPFISHREVFHGCLGVRCYCFPSFVGFFSHFSVYPSLVSFFFFSTAMRNGCIQFSILLKFSFFLERHLSLRSLFRTVTRCSYQHPPTLPLHSAGVKSN